MKEGKATYTVYPDGTKKGFFFEMEEDLHTEFKIKATQEKRKMTDILTELISKYVKR